MRAARRASTPAAARHLKSILKVRVRVRAVYSNVLLTKLDGRLEKTRWCKTEQDYTRPDQPDKTRQEHTTRLKKTKQPQDNPKPRQDERGEVMGMGCMSFLCPKRLNNLKTTPSQDKTKGGSDGDGCMSFLCPIHILFMGLKNKIYLL